MRAIIIGAGIGGLTTAIALKQAGIEVTVYERAPELRAVGAGLSLWANALKALDCIGVGDRVRQCGVHGHEAAIRAANGHILSAMSQRALSKHFGDTPIVVVHRADLMDILLNTTQLDVRCGFSFERYIQDKNGVTVYFDNGKSDSSDILIGADGIHSRVRQQILPDSRPIYSGYCAWRAITTFDHQRVNHTWGESWGIGKRTGVLPLTDNRVYWFATANRPQGEKLASGDSKTLLLDLFADWHQPVPDLLQATDANLILHNDILDIDPIATWYDGRVVLLGDAVHAMTPNMGQGACQAIEDGIVLARSLKTGATIADSFAQYTTIRQDRTKAIQLQSRRIGQVGQIENAALGWIRNHAVRLMPSALQVRLLDAVVGYDVATTV